MYRLSDMIGKPVVSTSSGDKLGTVSDALLDASAVQVVGLVVRHGLLAKEQVLPLEDVERVGRDAVLARSDEHLMTSREWRDSDVAATRSSAIRGRRVMTASGEQLGALSDILVDEETGAFDGLEIESHSFGGLRTRRTVLPRHAAPRIGPDAVIVRHGIVWEDDPAAPNGADTNINPETSSRR